MEVSSTIKSSQSPILEIHEDFMVSSRDTNYPHKAGGTHVCLEGILCHRCGLVQLCFLSWLSVSIITSSYSSAQSPCKRLGEGVISGCGQGLFLALHLGKTKDTTQKTI